MERLMLSFRRWSLTLSREQNYNLEYADDIVLLSNYAQTTKHALDRLAIKVSTYGVRFASSKYKVHPQDWQEPAPALNICANR